MICFDDVSARKSYCRYANFENSLKEQYSTPFSQMLQRMRENQCVDHDVKGHVAIKLVKYNAYV